MLALLRSQGMSKGEVDICRSCRACRGCASRRPMHVRAAGRAAARARVGSSGSSSSTMVGQRRGKAGAHPQEDTVRAGPRSQASAMASRLRSLGNTPLQVAVWDPCVWGCCRVACPVALHSRVLVHTS